MDPLELQVSSDDNKAQAPRRKSSSKGGKLPSGLKLSFICLIISVLILLVVFGKFFSHSFCWNRFFLTQFLFSGFYMDHILFSFGFQEEQYAVVIDAGSTGSRVLCYKFHKNFSSECCFLSILLILKWVYVKWTCGPRRYIIDLLWHNKRRLISTCLLGVSRNWDHL